MNKYKLGSSTPVRLPMSWAFNSTHLGVQWCPWHSFNVHQEPHYKIGAWTGPAFRVHQPHGVRSWGPLWIAAPNYTLREHLAGLRQES